METEPPAAMFYLNTPVRDLLNRMIRWYIYLKHGSPVDLGILDSNMESFLEKELFLLYRRTYPAGEYGQIWTAYDAVTGLWRRTAEPVAGSCGFRYPEETEKDMTAFIQTLREGGFQGE